MAVRKGAAHGDMLYSADGYVTAWFMWLLQGDSEAAKVFIGDSPELLSNTIIRISALTLFRKAIRRRNNGRKWK